MASNFGATFVPGGSDDYYMPEVVAPSPQRVTDQALQDDLERMELESRERDSRHGSLSTPAQLPDSIPSKQSSGMIDSGSAQRNSQNAAGPGNSQASYSSTMSKASGTDEFRDVPSFSPFPKVSGEDIPPTDEEKEGILWKARKAVLHSPNVSMQVTWARDVLDWAEICMEAAHRGDEEKPRASTPRIEHELRVDAISIISHLAEQDHPEALYIRSKWQEFGRFGNRIDKREAYSGYKRASELGFARADYRMGMLYESSNDMSKAKEFYYRGLGLKDSAALYRMGMMSLLGQHGESKDYPTALERIQEAADMCDQDAPQGAYVYGMLVGRELPDVNIPDHLLPHNHQTAKLYVEKSAYLGFAKAQLKMGQAYELCQLGCEFNASLSLHYYGLASKQGQPEAALGVSRWFLFGYEGVFKKNEELAYKYAQEAAATQLATGEFAMGYYNEIGIHVRRNVAEAKKWYKLAADHGNNDAVGRLQSLDQDQTLSKADHETTTLTRIKSQHGSQRGQRPERFKHQQQMPTLQEDGGSRESSQKPQHPDATRPGPIDTERPPAFNLTVNNARPGARPQSAAPYPTEHKPEPLNINRPRSTAPYPEDEMVRPAFGTSPGAHPQDGPRRTSLGTSPGLYPTRPGPIADRPSSAFGIRVDGGGPPIQPTGNLKADARGQLPSANREPGRPAAYRQPSPGIPPAGRNPMPPYQSGPPQQQQQSSRPAPAQPYPGGPGGPYGGPGAAAGRQSTPLQQFQSAPANRTPGPPQGAQPGLSNDRYPPMSGGVGSAGQPERPAKLPQAGSGPVGGGGAGRGAGKPPGRVQDGSAQPPRPAAGKSSLTFEEMGIPQGKQSSDCVVM